jgi:hypothetical protein
MDPIEYTRRDLRTHVLAGGAILVITVTFFLPVWQGRTFSMVAAHMFSQYPWLVFIQDSPDVRGRGFPQTDHAETFYPASVFSTNAVRDGQFPMWLPYSFGGVPIVEVGVALGLLYPPKLLLMTILSPVHQHDLILFVHLLVAGLGMYALLRCWGANALGALLGGIAWEFNGHNAFWLTLEHIAIDAAWFPLMMLGATLAVRKQSLNWAIAAGAAMGMTILNGDMLYVAVSALVLASWYGVSTFLAARRLSLKNQPRAVLWCLGLPVISLVVAAALSCASWLSFLSLLSHVHREPESLAWQLNEALPWRIVARGFIWPASLNGVAFKVADSGSFAFVGTPALVFSMIGWFRRSAPGILATITGLLSLGLILGVRPFIIALRLLPYFGAVHPIVGFYLSCFAFAALAAFGFTTASKYVRRFSSLKPIVLIVAPLLIALEAFQMVLFTSMVNPSHPNKYEWLFPKTPLINALKSHQGEYHILPINLHLPSGEWRPPVMIGKVAADFGLRSGSGYESLLPIQTAILWRTVENKGKFSREITPAYRPEFNHDRLPITLLEKLSVGLLATPPNVEPRDVNGKNPVASGALRLIYDGSDGRVYNVTRALPRAFLVPQVVAAPNELTSLAMLIDEKFDARKAAIVIGEGTARETGLPAAVDASLDQFEGTATIVGDRLNDVGIKVDTPRTAAVVLNDSWDQGWKVWVDGVERPVLRVNYAFRGVVVPAGQHQVVFQYRPIPLLIGIAISAITLLFVITYYLAVILGLVLRLQKLRQPNLAPARR